MTEKKKSKKSKDVSDPNEIKGIHQFIMGEKLGQGTFGKVRLATHVITGEKVAIKILEKDKIYQQEDKDRVEREIKILKMIRHNNLIQVYQVIQTPTLIYIVMEYSPGKDMFNYIVNNKKIKEDEACCYFQQLIEGVDYCHKLKICHRDLKPENLLLEGKTIKLIDFGLSNTWGKTGKLHTACGSPSYAAPEMILGETEYYGSRVDVWSVGVVLYVMVCGFLPFEDANQDKLYKKIIEGKYALPSFVSEPCKDLIRKVMNVDQEKRYTIAEIKMHPWYKSIAPKINEGLLSYQIVFPCDEEILEDMKAKGFNVNEVRESIIMNKHTHLSTSYYLLVKSKIRQGIESESDLFSDKYIKYVKNPNNLLSNYNNDLKVALEVRLEQAKLMEIEKSNKEKTKEPDYSSFKFVTSKSKDLDIEDKFANKDNDDLIENLKSLTNNGTLVNEEMPTTSNPFEVSIDVKNSVRDITMYSPNKLSGKTIVVTTNKKALISTMCSSRGSPLKTKQMKVKKQMRLNRPRNKSDLTTFDCSDLSTVKTQRDATMDKCEELRERVSKLKQNLKFNVTATFRRSSMTHGKTNNDKNVDKDIKYKGEVSKQVKIFGKSGESYNDKKSKLFESSESYKQGLK